MAVRTYEWQNPFGVVNIDGLDIISLEEKPIDKVILMLEFMHSTQWPLII